MPVSSHPPHLLLVAIATGLAACAPVEEAAGPVTSPGPVGAAWSAVQPGPLLDLVEAPTDRVPQGLACPQIDMVEGEETWTGGCALVDGTLIEGRLTRTDAADATWLTGEAFAVTARDGSVELYLDGVIALQGDGALLTMDVAATTCGVHVDCADGPVALDLRYDLLLPDDAPYATDASVRGFVALGDDEPLAVEGAWRVDASACELEPVDGLFAMQADQRQTLEHDGALSCDGCATWTVQGIDGPAWCPTE